MNSTVNGTTPYRPTNNRREAVISPQDLSADTLLRLVRGAVRPAHPPPRAVGIDEWAWRRGQNYGTILVDLERHTVIDVLADRETATVAAWLKRHDGIEVVARNRADRAP
jgi:transposase